MPLYELALYPNWAHAHAFLALILRDVGRTEEAVTVLTKAIHLTHLLPAEYLPPWATPIEWWGSMRKQPAAYKKAIHRKPDNLLARIGLTTTQSLSGRQGKARAAAAEVLRIHPKFSLEKYAKTLPL